MNYAAVVFFAIILFSLTYYFFPKYGAKNWFTGPVHTVRENITSESIATIQQEYIPKDQEGSRV
jgi:hypothetical protein